MHYSLTLVLPDGTTPVVRKPEPEPLHVPIGADLEVAFQLTGSNATPVNLAGIASDKLVLGVKHHRWDVDYLISRGFSLTSAPLGTGKFPLVPGDTAALSPQKQYWYDVWFTDLDGKQHQVKEASAFFANLGIGPPGAVTVPAGPLSTSVSIPWYAQQADLPAPGSLGATSSRRVMVGLAGVGILTTDGAAWYTSDDTPLG